MIENIIKRSGKVEKYNREKIEIAINKAIYAVTKENDYEKASFLTDFVERKLRDTIMGEHYGYIPDIETIQNIVENVLVENNNYDLAKAYILYRAKREGARDSQKMLLDINKTMDGYLGQGDWRVRENSNVNFSLGGLILHNSGSITANYWLKNIYPKEIAEAHQNCAFHLHDLSMLSPYCAGWSIRQLLQEGLGGVPDKISSTPPKHLSTAVHQMVNFLGVLQNEWAGAQAFSSFDTYLAPFIKKENLSEKEVRQALQNFLFGVNTPSRWGCVPLDTEILTKEGWKNYKDLRVGDKTIGFDNGHLIDDEVLKINEYDYKGDMVSLKNLKQDQLLTPNHRCIYRKYSHKVYNTENEFTVNEAGVIYNFNSYIDIPVTGVSTKKDFNISDDIIKLYSWLLFKGSFDDKNNSNISITAFNFSIYNSELRDIFKNLKIPFVIEEIIYKRTKYKSGYSYIFSIPKEIKKYFKPLLDKKLNMPLFRKLSQRQLKIFLQETCKSSYYLRNKNTIKIFDKSLLDDMMELAFLAGYSFSVRDSVEHNITQVKPCIILSLSKTDKMTTTIRDKKKEAYNGKVWCPTTKSSFWVAKRNNTVFITGNSQAPFTNITLDWVCPTDLRKQPVYIGGEKTDMVYGDCQKEMDMINKIFIELMLEGDANGRGFQYPIPTYNITSDFDWDSANAELLFKMTSKYGTPYFQNFINSDLNPEDVRSMCCRLQLDKRELRKRGGGIFGSDEFTGSIGVVTINLPQLGFLSKDEVDFYKRLDYLLELARQSLQIKRKVIQQLLDGGLYPYTKRYLKHLNNHFNTIGICGMNECCLNFLGVGISDKKGKEFAEKVLDYLLDKARDFQENDKLALYNIEATPAESCFGGDTTVYTLEGFKRIDSLVGKTNFPVFTWNEEKNIVEIKNALRVWKTFEKAKVFEVEFDNGLKFVCTNNHRFMKRKIYGRGKNRQVVKTWEMLKDLKVGDRLESIYFRDKKGMIINEIARKYKVSDEAVYNFLVSKKVLYTKGELYEEVYSHQIIAIRELEEEIPVYDMEVEDNHNFYVGSEEKGLILAHNCAFRFAKHDKENYPDIITSGTVDEPYYTNSTHLPVQYTTDVFEALDHQESLQRKYTGGTVIHVYLGEAVKDWQSCRDLVKSIAYNYKIPYFSISPTFSVCPIHGYLEGEQFECQLCKREKQVELEKKIEELKKQKEKIKNETN